MTRVPLEDNFNDLINKAQRGLGLGDAELSQAAGVSLASLQALKGGALEEAALRAVAPRLQLDPGRLLTLARKGWYPEQPKFADGFAAFNTPFEDMTVNAYLAWDPQTKRAVAFDTGANADPLLAEAARRGLKIELILLTHTHDDHVADLAKLVAATGAPVYVNQRESAPGARTFDYGHTFRVGALSLATLPTWGHSPGQTTFYATGLSLPLAVCGDAIFASSMGGSPTRYREAYANNAKHLFALPDATVVAPGHGPLTTIGQERAHNPFFASL